MHAALLVLASAAVGVDWGYRPLPSGGIEYIVQVEPQALDDLAAGGGEIVSHVPPELFDIRQFRITVGKQKLPRGGRVATTSRQQQAADGVQVTPAALTGGGNEHVVELDRAAIAQMKRAMDLVYEVQNVRRYRLRLRQADTARPDATPASHVAEVEPPAIERGKTPPAERESAPPFVPKAENDPKVETNRKVAKDPFPSGQPILPREDAPALPLATKPLPSTEAPTQPEPMPPAREPEPLKIDLAPAIENSPRPLRPAVAEPAEPTIQPRDKPDSAHRGISDPFPEPAARKAPLPENPINPEAGREPQASGSTSDPFPGEIQPPALAQPVEQPPQERQTIEPADWPSAMPMKPASPAAAVQGDARGDGKQTDPFAEPKTAPFGDPAAKQPANDTLTQPTLTPKEPGANSPPANRVVDPFPFPSLDNNPLRGPAPPDEPKGEARSPHDVNVNPASGSTPVNPTPGTTPGGSGLSATPPAANSDSPPAFGTSPPASNSLPPLESNTPFPPLGGASTSGPPGDAPKVSGDPFAPAFGGTSPPSGSPSATSSATPPGLSQPSSRQPLLTNDMSSMPQQFSSSQPPHQLTSFGGGPVGDNRAIPAAGDRHEEPAGPEAAAVTPPTDKKPWWGLTGALVVLFASLGGNAYLGWMNWDLRRQYTSLLEMFRQQRANKSRT